MPVRHRGYHHWDGELGSARWSWLAILGNGLKLGMQQRHAALLLWAGLPLALVAGVLFYFMAVFQEGRPSDLVGSEQLGFLFGILGLGRPRGVLAIQDMILPMWTLVFTRLCQAQLVLVLLVQAKFGSDSVAGDLRTNALPIYFSKPITLSTYLLGKWLVLVSFTLAVTLVPSLIAYAAGMLLSGPGTELGLTAGLLGRVVIQSLLVAGMASLTVLAMSSLTRDKRLVAVGWVALALVPMIVQGLFDAMLPAERLRGLLGSLSLPRNINRLTYWLLDVERAVQTSPAPELFAKAAGRDALGVGLGYAIAVLAAITAVSLIICVKRVRRFQVAVANA